MQRSLFLPLALVALAALTAFSPEAAGAEDDPALYALVFTADWCPSCAVLDPKLQAVESDLKTMGVEMVVLDLSDADSRRQAQATATEGGYADVFDYYAWATGYVLLMSPRTHEVLDRIVVTDTEADIRRKVRAALVHA